MHCASCSQRVQRSLRAVPAVASAAVNLATERAYVTFDPTSTSADDLCDAVAAAGYSAQPAPTEPSVAGGPVDRDGWWWRALVSWPLALAALLVALLAQEDATSGWTVLLLAVIVADRRRVALPALEPPVVASRCDEHGHAHHPRDARRAGRERRRGDRPRRAPSPPGRVRCFRRPAARRDGAADHLGSGHGPGHRGAGASAGGTGRCTPWSSLRPPSARLIVAESSGEGGDRIVAPEAVPVGARIRVLPGETVPLDGEVVQGWSAIDESMLTGEALPVEHGPGSVVTGGTRNGAGVLVVSVQAVAAESVLARLQRVVDDALGQKATLERLADRISAVFVPAVLAVSAATFLGWWLLASNLGTAVLSAIAVLLVACPCAMGLATPVAMMVGCGRASALGILIRNVDALERLAHVDTVAFDKTGTLTMGIATVVAVAPAKGFVREDVLGLAAPVEADIEHPIARAICAAHGPSQRATDVAILPGAGVAGRVGGRNVRVVRAHGDALPSELARGRRGIPGKGRDGRRRGPRRSHRRPARHLRTLAAGGGEHHRPVARRRGAHRHLERR